LPSPLSVENYFVTSSNLTDTEFAVSLTKNGAPVVITNAGTGTHSYAPVGITLSQTRENYNYLDFTIFQPGEYTDDFATGQVCTISVADPTEISLVGHPFVENDVIKFTTTGTLPAGIIYTI